MPPSQTGSNATSPSRRPAARCSRRELIVEASEKLLLSDANAGLCVGAAGGSIIGLTIDIEKFANRFGNTRSARDGASMWEVRCPRDSHVRVNSSYTRTLLDVFVVVEESDLAESSRRK